MSENNSLLEAEGLIKSYAPEGDGILSGLFSSALGPKRIPALNGVSLTIEPGEFIGLTGESGSGKSALGKVLAGIERADKGSVRFMGQSLSNEAAHSKARRFIRYIAEENLDIKPGDPNGKLGKLLYNLVEKYPTENGKQLADQLLRQVGLDASILDRFPNQISGGQRQRFMIARALATKPKLVVADESVSNLDLENRQSVLNVMKRAGREYGTAFVFISHEPSTVHYFAASGRTAIMFAGRIMEIIPTAQLFSRATHPYTKTLFAANPNPSPLPGAALDPALSIGSLARVEEDSVALGTLESEVSDLSLKGNQAAAAQLAASSQPGCPFYTWCPEHHERCLQVTPQLLPVTRNLPEGAEPLPQHRAACLNYIEQ